MSARAKKSSFRTRRGQSLPCFAVSCFGRLAKRGQSGQEIAEFGSVLLVILLLLFFPMVDMVLYFASYGAVYETCNLAVHSAGTTFTHTAAVSAVTSLFTNPFIQGLQKAARVTSTGAADTFSPGYKLILLQGTSASASLTAVTPGSVTLPVPSGTFYLYEEVADMTMAPLFPLPMIGSGNAVNFHATCYVEHPEGLNQ